MTVDEKSFLGYTYIQKGDRNENVTDKKDKSEKTIRRLLNAVSRTKVHYGCC